MSKHGFFIQEITPDLTEASIICANGFEQPLTDRIREGVKSHTKGDLVYSVFDEIGLIGFYSFDLKGGDLHLHGAMLHPRVQASGITCQVIDMASKRFHCPEFLFLTTQSLRMWSAMKKSVEQMYPHSNNDSPEDIVKKADSLCKILEMSAPIDPAFYSRPLYGYAPSHPNPDLQEWWNSFCPYPSTCAVLCLGRLKR